MRLLARGQIPEPITKAEQGCRLTCLDKTLCHFEDACDRPIFPVNGQIMLNSPIGSGTREQIAGEDFQSLVFCRLLAPQRFTKKSAEQVMHPVRRLLGFSTDHSYQPVLPLEGHTYGNTILGLKEGIRQATRELIEDGKREEPSLPPTTFRILT
jgi:hypothetical protein